MLQFTFLVPVLVGLGSLSPSFRCLYFPRPRILDVLLNKMIILDIYEFLKNDILLKIEFAQCTYLRPREEKISFWASVMAAAFTTAARTGLPDPEPVSKLSELCGDSPKNPPNIRKSAKKVVEYLFTSAWGNRGVRGSFQFFTSYSLQVIQEARHLNRNK